MRLTGRVLVAALALALVVGGVLAAVEIVVAGLGREPWVVPHDHWYDAGLRNRWSSAPARWAFIGSTLGGFGLLLLAVISSRRPEEIPMAPGRQPTVVDRRSTERAISDDVRRVDGVSGARARIGRRSTDVVAATNRRVPGDLKERVGTAVDERLRRLALAEVPPVRVRLHQRRQR